MSETIQVTFWGARGSVATPGRTTEKYGGNTACVSVKIGKVYFIFDAGTGLRQLGQAILAEGPVEGLEIHLFLSHTHWDHIQGLPFFEPAYTEGVHLKIYGNSRGGRLSSILKGQMDKTYFPVPMSALGARLDIVDLKEGVSIDVDDVRVVMNELNHPGGCVGFRLEHNNKSIVYATDNELDALLEPGGDIEVVNSYREFISGVDLLIADGQYTADEYPQKRGWGHSTAQCMLEQAYKSNVKTVAVFHHDPMHTDSFLDDFSAKLIDSYDRGHERDMAIFWAREQMSVPVR